MGLGPAGMRTDDHIVVLHGDKVPYVLRPDFFPFNEAKSVLRVLRCLLFSSSSANAMYMESCTTSFSKSKRSVVFRL